jgi:hypothetical protein
MCILLDLIGEVLITPVFVMRLSIVVFALRNFIKLNKMIKIIIITSAVACGLIL